MRNKISYSVVVEGDNFIHCDPQRSVAGLVQLFKQMRAVSQTGEVLLALPHAVDASLLTDVIAQHRQDIPVRTLVTTETHYFALKNQGIREAAGEIIVCMDSDVIPEDNWLGATLRAFEDPAVSIAAGSTYIELKNFYYKTIALSLCFPLRPTDDQMHPGERFFANNLAARKETWQKFPFPSDTFRCRGQQVELEAALKAHGITVWQNHGARVMHPPPNGFFHFFEHAVAEGFDAMTTWKKSNRFYVCYMHLFFWIIHFEVSKNLYIIKNARKAELAIWQIPFACLVHTTYYGIGAVAAGVSFFFPAYIRILAGK